MKINLLRNTALFLLALATRLAAQAPDTPQDSPQAKPLDYFIVVTGGELLAGAYADAHTHYMVRTLHPLGCRCVGSLIVDDERADILDACRYATNHAALVVVTGGLGPTPNDITRQVLSEFTGIPLQENPEVVASLERRLHQTRAQLLPNLLQQARIPARGGFLPNPNGTAAGLLFEMATATVVALPGPPRELQPMVRNELTGYLRRRFGVRDFGTSLTLRFVGVGQSVIDQAIKDHVAVAPDVTITSLFEGSRVDFTFSLPGNQPADRERLKKLEANLREHLEEYIYAADGSTLEEVVLRKILAGGGPLTLVEIGSRGVLATALGTAPEAARGLAGSFAAPAVEGAAQLLRISPTALAAGRSAAGQTRILAGAALETTHSPWVLAVGPAETDAKNNRSVPVVIKFPDGHWDTQKVGLRDAGELGRLSLTTQILDLLRRRIQ